jgi:hypothetical protein
MNSITREDIIRMAQEASGTNDIVLTIYDCLATFAALVAAAEREACMKSVKEYLIPVGSSRAGELACEWNVRTS